MAVYTDPETYITLDDSQTLTGGDVLPEFSLAIATWFARAERRHG